MNFLIEINIRIYINKKIAKKKNLFNILKNVLNLSTVEKVFLKKFNIFISKKEPEFFQRIAIIQINIIRKINKTHDLKDFSLEKTDRILKLIIFIYEQHLRSKINLIIEI